MRLFPAWFGEKPLTNDQLLEKAIQHYQTRLNKIPGTWSG